MGSDDEAGKPDPDYDDKVRVALDKIGTAFAALKYPGETAIRDGSTNMDLADLMADFRHRHWSELLPDRLRFHREVLPIMGAVARRFYLPAYMRASLTRSPHEGEIREYTLFALRPTRSTPAERESFTRQLSLLDEAQKDAVRAFLRAAAADYGRWRSDPAMREWGIKIQPR